MKRVVIYTGNGKGKTTAAIGSAIRAMGHGMRVYFHQFVKDDKETGEYRLLRKLNGIDIEQSGLGFTPALDHPHHTRHRLAAENGLLQVARNLQARQYDVIVMDEVCTAIAKGLLRQNDVAELLKTPHCPKVCILTGRSAPRALLDIADTVSTISATKHALHRGVAAQEGIEF